MVENPPANAGDTGSSPGPGRSHMPRSNWAHEPQLLSLRVWSLCSATREATIVRDPRTPMKSGPRLPQLEKALAQKRRPNTAINKFKKFKKKPKTGPQQGGFNNLKKKKKDSPQPLVSCTTYMLHCVHSFSIYQASTISQALCPTPETDRLHVQPILM